MREADDWKATRASIAQKAVPFCVGLAMVSAAAAWVFYSRDGAVLSFGACNDGGS